MGNYETPPGRRIPYDIDGSVLQALEDGEVTPDVATQQEMTNMNDESNSAWNPSNWGLAEWGEISILFPDFRDLDGIFVSNDASHPGDSIGACYTSINSTNGFDGDWVEVVPVLTDHHGASEWRDGIDLFGAFGIKAVKFAWYRYIGDLGAIHIYGLPGSAATVDRLQILDPLDSDNPFDPLHDYEEVPRGQVQQRTIKIKNLSATLTAQSVIVTVEALTGISDEWYTFSDDDISYGTSLDLGDMTPGQVELVYVKQGVPASAAVGPASARIKAAPASWV